jgi:hypothetical protein
LPDEWDRRRHGLFPTTEGARAAVAQTREASRANRRVRRNGNRDLVASQTRRAGALGTSAEVVDEIVRLLVEWERDGRDDVALGQQLRPAFATTLRAYGEALRSAGTRYAADEAAAVATADAVARLDEAVDELRGVVRAAQRSSERDYFVAGALIVNLARGADALHA